MSEKAAVSDEAGTTTTAEGVAAAVAPAEQPASGTEA